MADSIPHPSTVAEWSQAIPSVTFHYNLTASSTLPLNSPYYFEPDNYNYNSVLFISSCTICGQPQHLAPRTMMNSIYQTNSVESTPIPYLEDESFPMRMMGGRLPNHLLRVGYSNNKRPHRELVSFMRDAFYKMTYICSSVLRPQRRHNIYPSQ